jgi:hypothetical protein
MLQVLVDISSKFCCRKRHRDMQKLVMKREEKKSIGKKCTSVQENKTMGTLMFT